MSTQANRAPGSIWTLRRDLGFPFIRTAEADRVEVIFDPAIFAAVPLTNVMSLTRRDARLLARRINECLDATVKR